MLEDRLGTLLDELRAEKTDRKTGFEMVRSWFQEHEENLAHDIADMAFICELPNDERTLLTYPVMGNWYLENIAGFEPETEHQQSMYVLLRDLIIEKRFNNNHTRQFYDGHQDFNMRWDKLNSMMLADPEGFLPLNNMMRKIHKNITTAVYDELEEKECHTIDLGHGLAQPSGAFEFLTWYYEALIEKDHARPLDLTIMIVDDQEPEIWYKRMLSVGFKDIEGQQGYFFDCESALEALKKGRYDVILTDLELGDGKMGGIEFVERAFDIQKTMGVDPRISVFSYNDERLREAEKQLHDYSGNMKVFHQVNYNNKRGFTAIGFRLEVGYTLR